MVAERVPEPPIDPAVPLVIVADTRLALSALASAFHDHSLDVVTEPAELLREKMPDRAFISGDGLNINKLARERDNVDVHAVGKA